jgi:hypothetical protein
LWTNDFHDKTGKGPLYRGNLVADRDIKEGEEIPLSVFRNEQKNERSPSLRVNIDRWKENQKRDKPAKVPPQTPQGEIASNDPNDSIPF